MEQKLIITDSSQDVNKYLVEGWTVISITPQHVSTNINSSLRGNFAILLEKIDNKSLTYTEEEVSRLLETQRGNCYVAIYNYTTNQELATVAGAAPEPGQWRK